MPEKRQEASSVLATLFHHNTWANRKLLDFCAGLSAAQLDTTAAGGFGSIRAALVHLVSSEADYVNLVVSEHWTQIATVITQPGSAPPALSGWQYLREMATFRELPESGASQVGVS